MRAEVGAADDEDGAVGGRVDGADAARVRAGVHAWRGRVTPIASRRSALGAPASSDPERRVEEGLGAELGDLGRAHPAASRRLVEGVAQVADLARPRHQAGAVGDPLDVAHDRDPRAGRRAHRGRISAGAPCACRAAGRATEPSSRWPFSSRAMIVRPTATAVPLSVWTGSVPDVAAHARPQAARLVVGAVRAGGDLAVGALAGHPRLAVELARRRTRRGRRRRCRPPGRGPRARRRISSCTPRMRSCSAGESSGMHEREHLDLVELVHAEDAAGVAARGPRLPAEAGRDARRSAAAGPRPPGSGRRAGPPAAPRRCPPGRGRRRPSRRSRTRSVGKKPVPVHRLLAHQHRGHDRGEPGRLDAVERQRHQRQLHPHERPQQVGEAAARDAGGRLQVERARRGRELHVVARGEAERRRLADPPQLDARRPRRRRGRRPPPGSAATASSPSRSLLGRAQLPLEGGELLAQPARLGLLGGAVAALRAAPAPTALLMRVALGPRRLDPRAQRAGALVQLQQAGDLVAGPAPREVGGHALRLGADQLQVEQGAPGERLG